jgi:hypothetical protein
MQRRAPGIHQPHRITDDVLSLIADLLDLARLAPSANDHSVPSSPRHATDQPHPTPKPGESSAAYGRTTTSTRSPGSFPHNYRTAGQPPEQPNRTRPQATPATPRTRLSPAPNPNQKTGHQTRAAQPPEDHCSVTPTSVAPASPTTKRGAPSASASKPQARHSAYPTARHASGHAAHPAAVVPRRTGVRPPCSRPGADARTGSDAGRRRPGRRRCRR